MNKYFLIITSILFFFTACKNESEVEVLPVKKEKIVYDFGFKLNDFYVIRDTVKTGDSFSSIIEKQNLAGKQIYSIIDQVKDSFDIKTIKIKNPYTLLLEKNKTKKLNYFIYQPDLKSYYILDLRDSISFVKQIFKPVSYKRRTVAGQLNGSLSETLKNEGASASLTSELMNVYKWSIDFFKSKKGDKFAITFTERYINDSIYDGVDSLHASFFEYKGEKIYAFPYKQNPDSELEYFDEEGKLLKNFFLKAPLKTINITSRFSNRRFHPVQMRFKPHNGTDYAAPHGTPVMSTANGVVEQVGYTAGNGNFVKIKHDKTYATQYLHLSRILVRKRQRITQGQTIGKVGSTGLATGPHVCYRFWKNGKQVDALRLKLPNSVPMNKNNLPAFLNYIKPLKKVLDSVSARN